jgi:hypothetical protein
MHQHEPDHEPNPMHAHFDSETGVRGGQMIPAGLAILGLVMFLQEQNREMITVEWEDFGSPFERGDRVERGDGDVIQLQEEVGDPNLLKVTLHAGDGITWWKGIEAWRADDRTAHHKTWTQDDRRTDTMEIPNDQVATSILVFLKAKKAGVHTRMYCVRELAPKAGKHLSFTWERDSR